MKSIIEKIDVIDRFNEEFDFRFVNISSLILKVTNRCNIDCSYCYENIIPKGNDMDLNTFKKIIQKTINSTTSNTLNVIFHGGEPTLLDDEWYINAVEYAINIAHKKNIKITFGIQTNLVSLRQSTIDLFKYLKIDMGVSIDNPFPKVNESLRQNTEIKVTRNIDKLIQSNLKFGLLMTINQGNYNDFDEIINWIEKKKIKSFKANVVYPVGNSLNKDCITTEQIFNAKKSILNYIIKTNGEKVIEYNVLKAIINYFSASQNQSLCDDMRCGAGSRVLGISSDGSILPCGRFQWNDTNNKLGYLSELNESNAFYDKVDGFHNIASENFQNCYQCEANKICSYGCQAFISRSKAQKNIECSPTILFYQLLKENEMKLKLVYEKYAMKQFDKNNYSDSYSDYNDTKYNDYSDYYDKSSGGNWD